jgi:phospholipid/cholesterol/gamma-HCH transport system ATP-binding protein
MITFDNVGKYLAGYQVLKGVSFTVKKGETFVVVGPTGTGKSVLLRHIVGFHRPDSGSLTVAGHDMTNISGSKLEALRSKVGMLFQSGALLNWMNVRDNVALPLREKRKFPEDAILDKVNNALKILGLENAGDKMPAEISGGMKKRAGIARAIVIDPEIALYDEPTSGLDPIMSRKIDAIILDLKHRLNITSIVVTHDLVSAFAVADRIALLANGKVVECSTPEEFKNSQNKYSREFIAAQLDHS